MKSIYKPHFKLLLLSVALLLGLTSCENEDEGLPITNDLRVLQVLINDMVASTGVGPQRCATGLFSPAEHRRV